MQNKLKALFRKPAALYRDDSAAAVAPEKPVAGGGVLGDAEKPGAGLAPAYGKDGDAAAEAGDGMPVTYSKVSRRKKLMVAATLILMTAGAHFTGAAFNTLKTKLTDPNGEMQLTGTQFSVVQASTKVLNVIMPLFTGMMIDIFGTGLGALISTACVFGGNFIIATSLSSASFSVLVIGRVVEGVGSASLGTVHRLIVAQWFSKAQLGTAMSVLLVLEGIAGTVGKAIIVPASVGHHYSFGMWIGVWISLASAFSAVGYIFLMLVVNRQQKGASINFRQVLSKRKPFSPRAMFHFPTVFWLIMLLNFVSGLAQGAWGSTSTDFLAKRDGTDDVSAIFKGIVAQVISAVVGLIAGPVLDRFGYLISLSLVAHYTLVAFFVLMVFTTFSSQALLIILAMVGPMKMLAVVAATPILVHSGHLGTAFAAGSCIHSIASTIADVSVGRLQDADNGGYATVGIFLVVTSSVALVLCAIWFWVDRVKYASLLQKKNTERAAYMEEKERAERKAEAAGVDIVAGRRIKPLKMLYVAIFFVMLNVAWVLFLVSTLASFQEDKNKHGKAGRHGGGKGHGGGHHHGPGGEGGATSSATPTPTPADPIASPTDAATAGPTFTPTPGSDSVFV